MSKRTTTARKWNGKWRVDVQRDGIRKSFYSSTPGRAGQRECHAKADAWLEDGIAVRSGRVSDIYDNWLDDLKLTTSQSNWRPLDSRWRTWVDPVLGHKRVNSLTEQDLQDVINKAHAAGKSKKTLQSLCADLRAFVKYCRKRKLTTFTPEDLKVPAGARYKGKAVLQPKDLILLFNKDQTTLRGKVVRDEFINAYRFQVLTGLRPGELIGLQWDDVSGNTVYVRRAINVEGETTQGKNQNAVRSFVLSDMARCVLDEQREHTGDCPTVFEVGREEYYARRWKIYAEYNGITPVSPYELRHTFVSVVKTLPAGEVKGLVGHSQDMDTFGIYGHSLAGDDERTAAAVNGVFLRVLNA